MNLEQQFLDCNSTPFAGKKILFTPLKSVISSSYYTTKDSYQFTTDTNGTISSSVSPANYSVQVSEPYTPVTNFFMTVGDTGSFIISGSSPTGSAQYVVFNLQNLVLDYTKVKKLTLSPVWNYPFDFSGSIIVLSSTSSIPDINGSVTYSALIPGIYRWDAYGKVITSKFISVPPIQSLYNPGGFWWATDLEIVEPSKGIPVTLNDQDNSFVLTVSASDARYLVSASREGFDGSRPITALPYIGEIAGTTTVVGWINQVFYPFIEASVSINGGTTYYETGSSPTITVNGTVTENNETLFNSGSVLKDGSPWNTFSPIPPDAYSFNDVGVTSNHTYQTFVSVNTGGSVIINSTTKTSTFIFPFLYGTSTNPNLSGSTLYSALNKSVTPVGDKSFTISSATGTYLYFAYPSSYPDLTDALDPNLFHVLTSYSQSLQPYVGAGGITNTYKVYRWNTLADFSGVYQWKF